MRRCWGALLLIASLAHVMGQDLYSLIPPATDFYKTQGLKYFGPTQIRFSMTVIASHIEFRRW